MSFLVGHRLSRQVVTPEHLLPDGRVGPRGPKRADQVGEGDPLAVGDRGDQADLLVDAQGQEPVLLSEVTQVGGVPGQGNGEPGGPVAQLDLLAEPAVPTHAVHPGPGPRRGQAIQDARRAPTP